MFNDLDYLEVQDEIPFEYEFFIPIAWSFPLLKYLSILNLSSQSSISKKFDCNDNQLYSIVKYPYLISLNLYSAHNDYVEQFLNDRKTYLSHLDK
ncbi:unnamed protein product [Rotaria sp. Silwood1]|nr:unnamed protein product [Rotaria sp. Silwood1]CAF1614547.1 unnamed protein product [Rotaria sp. Silwood1]CAF3694134.1 unnamed protein product [Rotaria sp. Silwood1]CAF4695771.1 unnamed protein product [Rotaria sp. Silwood1]CAF4831173.1 unnamed protein product [Rotaria sp. Silwood1]